MKNKTVERIVRELLFDMEYHRRDVFNTGVDQRFYDGYDASFRLAIIMVANRFGISLYENGEKIDLCK